MVGVDHGRSRSKYIVIDHRETARTIGAMWDEIGDVQKISSLRVCQLYILSIHIQSDLHSFSFNLLGLTQSELNSVAHR